MTAFIVVLFAAIGTYLIRVSGVALLGRERELPPRVTKALGLVVPAAMAAIVADSLLLADDGWRPLGAWHLAAIVAVGIALWTRSAGWTIAAGAAAFAGLLVTGG